MLIAYTVAGYPTPNSTVPIMLQMQANGVSAIELGTLANQGVPFSDPIADGPTIAHCATVALENGTSLASVLGMCRDARLQGVTVPIYLMGYYNPFLQYGANLLKDIASAGANGLLIVDLPPNESAQLCRDMLAHNLAFIPLVSPTTSDQRLKSLVAAASSFIYVVSSQGVTGNSNKMTQLPDLIQRLRKQTSLPLAVGFGVATRQQYLEISNIADSVVIGTQILKELDQHNGDPKAVGEFCFKITQEKIGCAPKSMLLAPTVQMQQTFALESRFGGFGGQYAPEALIQCLDEFEQAFFKCKSDPSFSAELQSHSAWANRPSSLHVAPRLLDAPGARVWLKREDLNHTGSHKINNALGQVLLAIRLGKTRIIAETGAGQHGVATATVCAKFGLECIVYMGQTDIVRQALNVFRMKLLGAKVVAVTSGSQTLKDAINEAMRDWVANSTTTHYLVGSAIGPHPFPTVVKHFQACIGNETRAYFVDQVGKLPTAVVACVGGGSNAIGMFGAFLDDKDVKLIGVEAGGEGLNKKHSAPLSAGSPGVLHGCRTYLMQDSDGQILETHSISAVLLT